jgi:hypothetical protein
MADLQQQLGGLREALQGAIDAFEDLLEVQALPTAKNPRMARQDLLDKRGSGSGHSNDENRHFGGAAEEAAAFEKALVERRDDAVGKPAMRWGLELPSPTLDGVACRGGAKRLLAVSRRVEIAGQREMEAALIFLADAGILEQRLDQRDHPLRRRQHVELRQAVKSERGVGLQRDRAQIVLLSPFDLAADQRDRP